jgi:RNA polymerase sigma-70 factor (ECF subfamily)
LFGATLASQTNIARAAAPVGVEISFARVFEEHVGYVGRVLRHLGVREPDLEDVVQDVFVQVHRGLTEFEGRASIRTWVYRIAWNTAANHRRKRDRAAQRRGELDDEPAVPATQEAELSRKRAREKLGALLANLSDDGRAVFVLYEIEQLSMREVCEVIGCPLQTGYSRLKAARASLEQAAMRLGMEAES